MADWSDVLTNALALGSGLGCKFSVRGRSRNENSFLGFAAKKRPAGDALASIANAYCVASFQVSNTVWRE